MNLNSLTASLMVRDARQCANLAEELFKVWSTLGDLAEPIKEVPNEHVDYVDYVYDKVTEMSEVAAKLKELLALSKDHQATVEIALQIVAEKAA